MPTPDFGERGEFMRVGAVECVECPECLFQFGATHDDGVQPVQYTCPNCGYSAEAERID